MCNCKNDHLENEYSEWLDENCTCDLIDDECTCKSIEDWLEDLKAARFYGIDEQDYQEMYG